MFYTSLPLRAARWILQTKNIYKIKRSIKSFHKDQYLFVNKFIVSKIILYISLLTIKLYRYVSLSNKVPIATILTLASSVGCSLMNYSSIHLNDSEVLFCDYLYYYCCVSEGKERQDVCVFHFSLWFVCVSAFCSHLFL